MQQGPYANPSVLSLSLDQSKQWDSPNGKIWCQIDTSLLNFGNAKRLCLFCLMRQKHCWSYFAFN